MMSGMTVLDTMELSPSGLAALMKESLCSTLVVDCRGFTEFNTSHVKYSVNAFFSKLIRKRLFEHKLENDCLVNHLAKSASEKPMDKVLDVVLYAEEDKPRGNKRRIASCNAPESSAKVLRVLRERLEETSKFRGVMILEGGYNKFAQQYPHLCESSEGMTRLPTSLSQPCLSNPNGDGITLITPNIYLGSQIDSLDQKMLQALGITAVINLSVTCPKSVCITDDKNFMRIPVNDSYQEKLLPFFEQAYDFLENIRKTGKKCLIHCLAGISRSPTLCISYIMRQHQMGSDDAYRYVKEKRPSISPNFNFMGQLLEYEDKLIRDNVIRPQQASKPTRQAPERPICLNDAFHGDLAPPKVPKSASSHCVFSPAPAGSESPSSLDDDSEPKSDPEPSTQINENGKRGMELLRPRNLLGLPKKVLQCSQPDIPSPSTELSRLSFEGALSRQGMSSPTCGEQAEAVGVPSTPCAEPQLTFANPCFNMPIAPTREMSLPLGSAFENPIFYKRESGESCSLGTPIPSTSTSASGSGSGSGSASGSQTAPTVGAGCGKMGFNFRLWKKPSNRTSSRPECLRSSGVLINSPIAPTQLLATTEEEAESPESGFNEDMKSCPEDDRQSISSQSSLEIPVN